MSRVLILTDDNLSVHLQLCALISFKPPPNLLIILGLQIKPAAVGNGLMCLLVIGLYLEIWLQTPSVISLASRLMSLSCKVVIFGLFL